MHGSARKCGFWSPNAKFPLALANFSAFSQPADMFRFVMSAVLAVAASSAPAADQAMREATGNWNVDYAEHQCVASRPFGSAAEPLHLLVKPSPTTDVVQLALVKNGSSSKGLEVDAKLTLGNSSTITAKQLSYGTSDKSVRLINLGGEQAALLGMSDGIIWDASGETLQLKLGPMAPLMQVLADCRADLADYWNVGEEHAARLKSTAAPEVPLITYFNSNDYPMQAIRQEEQGTVSAVLLIDETGAIRDCMVQQTSGVAVLDAQTCMVFKSRAKFRPAIGVDGKPVRSSFTQRIRWELPG